MRLKAIYKHLFISFILFSVLNCKEDKSTKPEDKVVFSFKKEGVLSIKKSDSDSIIKTIAIEIADNDYETQTGLMYRNSLEANHGMLFIFPDSNFRNFYMKNTKIPLDIIYLDKNKVIVSVQKNAKPFDETSLSSEEPAKYALEINAGLFDTWQVEVGDIIDYEVL